MFDFRLPDLGKGLCEAEILHWHIRTGQEVGLDEVIVELETDKSTVAIPSPAAGRVVAVHGAEGNVIRVGDVLVSIDDGAEHHDAALTIRSAIVVGPEFQGLRGQRVCSALPVANHAHPSTRGPIPATPATRRVARELGVDLCEVRPSGPDGRVTTCDVRRFAASRVSGAYGVSGSHESPDADASYHRASGGMHYAFKSD